MTTAELTDSLNIAALAARYRDGTASPTSVARDVLRRIDDYDDPAIWIDLFGADEVLAQADRVEERLAAGETLPLAGIPFAVKDNIDVAGHSTTAACREFAYRPARTATVVAKLCDAGAVLIGKTNLDQFATGLVGTRSPYGTPRNPFDARYIPGGSSSGSAVAVSAGLVSFALGTDTAGSGRVPAAFNNIVGLKPTPGRISTTGVVPACRSLDCVSVFALCCDDAAAVLRVAEGYDAQDLYGQKMPAPRGWMPPAFRFGVPRPDQLRFPGDAHSGAMYRQAVKRLESLGGTAVEIDFSPFADAGALLYGGPWLAERMTGIRDFLADRFDALLPVIREILHWGRRFDAVGAFEGFYELRQHQRLAEAQWAKMDLMVLPTTGTIYTLEEIEADPVRRNSVLGYYTNFVNLMNLCALAVPAGFMANGLPAGVTLIAPPGGEAPLLDLGDALHRSAGVRLGATGDPLPPALARPDPPSAGRVRLAVVGAHLSGMPLNRQLTDLGSTFVRVCRTAPIYKLFALAGATPPKPGLVRVESGNGAAIELEVWEMSAEAFGQFVAAIPPPLGVGTVQLEDSEQVKCFVCESYATAGARDITAFGGWRKFVSPA